MRSEIEWLQWFFKKLLLYNEIRQPLECCKSFLTVYITQGTNFLLMINVLSYKIHAKKELFQVKQMRGGSGWATREILSPQGLQIGNLVHLTLKRNTRLPGRGSDHFRRPRLTQTDQRFNLCFLEHISIQNDISAQPPWQETLNYIKIGKGW